MLPVALAAASLLAGQSVEGREIRAVRQGDPTAPRRVLVVGSIHGSETAGHAVIRALRRMDAPAGVQLWTVRAANPDGARAGTRQNARGVDLNRNFPYRWRGGGRPFDTYYPGRRPASEPETRAMQKLIRRVRPDVTIWFHQHMRLVVLTPGADRALIRGYARRVRLPARTLPHYRGTATSWQNAKLPGSSAFVVELAAGRLRAAEARRHARAALATVARSARSAAAPRPPIAWSPIPFGRDRKRQTSRYSRRHYGHDSFRLVEPRTIVQHYTATRSYAAAWKIFAANRPDVEFGERPGVCTHFIVDRDGTIHQLVPLGLMCRHTVGLNDVSIGVEHVGTSDAQVMGNRRQLRASLRLTRWLQARHAIPTRHVIGHAESLSSPFHHERVRAMRKRTHGDMGPRTMRRYRKLL
ncbi:MAG TPA: N-acetylmuramoyl-L-alanine amidase [Solirubrobacteraceae bacterium]|nr:N-acetylmuramoyl-L-alanine amidase [Solirubrobacteraceae bacterium]